MDMLKHRPKLSVAPMMAWTHRYFRAMMRSCAPKALLYTEMITAQALVLGQIRKPLVFDDIERPLVCQLGGSDPDLLSQACHITNNYDFDEINLNAGCPSPKVSQCDMGAKLMTKPHLLWACFEAMKEASKVPVSVKCRLGVDEFNDYAFIHDLIAGLVERGCETVTVHARNAWLDGVSPKHNRTIPPLNYQRVYQLKRDFSALCLEINGGFKKIDEVKEALQHVDGVMIGRLCYEDPYAFAKIHHMIEGGSMPSRYQIVKDFMSYYHRFLPEKRLQHTSHGLYQLFKHTPFSKALEAIIGQKLSKP